MIQLIRQFFSHVSTLFKRFPPERRVAMGVIFLAIITACVVLFVWALKPQYKMLYSDLSLEDSGKIVQVLEEEKIPFRIEREGQSILVPSEKVYETRMKLASQELPSEGGTGWEIFDKPSLGVTDFVQKLNFRRGLEGELSRTILQLEPVEAVRVHLVMPKESLFRETQKEPMASVSLRLRRGQQLSAEQVDGISHMVASAVEGLKLENVTVIDSKGYVLSERKEADSMIRLTATQLDIQNRIENRLQEKGRELLDRRFGPGRSTIQVTAKLDFRTLETTSEQYDSDNPAVRSEEFTTSTSTGSDTSSSNTENNVTNYELSLTQERRVKPVGEIERLTIAIMVDGNYIDVTDSATGEAIREFIPLESSELTEIGTTIKMALGFDAQRGDEMKVTSVPMQETEMIDIREMTVMDRWSTFYRYTQKIAPLVAILFLLLLIRNFLRKAEYVAAEGVARKRKLQLAPGAEEKLLEALHLPDIEAGISAEARKDAQLHAQVVNYIKDKPETAAKLVRSWLMD